MYYLDDDGYITDLDGNYILDDDYDFIKSFKVEKWKKQGVYEFLSV